MATEPQQALFPMILASSVHDIKNALGTVQELVQHLRQKPALADDVELQQLEFEAIRINQSLVQLLMMYRMGNRSFYLMVDQYPASDLLQEARHQQQRLLSLKHLQLELECAEELMCYCDFQQLSQVLASMLNNAARFSRQHIVLSAYEEAGYIVFALEDDGEGYPESLLEMDWQQPVAAGLALGQTGLGLFFAAMIAKQHKNADRYGAIRLDNQSRFGGGRCRLFLP